MDEKDEIVARLATNVRYYRTQRGWSQAELAARVGVDTRQIGRIEQQVNVPSFVLTYHIAQAFEVTLDDLITRKK
jgi:transcriptional regulator with XRE-family HTH domain